MREFLDRHVVLDGFVYFLVMLGLALICFFGSWQLFPGSEGVILGLASYALVFLFYTNYIRPTFKKRESNLRVLFDVLSLIQGIILGFHATFGLRVPRSGKVLIPALWQFPLKQALSLASLEIGLLLFWLVLRYLATKHQLQLLGKDRFPDPTNPKLLGKSRPKRKKRKKEFGKNKR